MSNPFPSNNLSLQTIGNAFGLSAPYKMRDLSGKRVYLANGTRLFVTYPTNLNFNFFRGKYSTAPKIGPFTFPYFTSGTVTYPTGQTRAPTKIDIFLSGGGGGGGGGEEAEYAVFFCIKGENGGSGGNGFTDNITNIDISNSPTITIAIGGGGGGGAGGNSGGGGGKDGDDGVDGGITTVTVGTIPSYTAGGGGKGGGGGHQYNGAGGGGVAGGNGGAGGGGGGACGRGGPGGGGAPGYVLITWYYEY